MTAFTTARIFVVIAEMGADRGCFKHLNLIDAGVISTYNTSYYAAYGGLKRIIEDAL